MSYWLVKSEEDVYSIQHLRKDRKTHWHGVRNYQARNYLKQMKKGDLVLYYHSNCEKPGVVGVAKVVKEAYPDPSQFEKSSEYFDPKASIKEPRWFCPDLAYDSHFSQVIELNELRAVKALAQMPLLRKGNRLSVLPVSEREYSLILALIKS
jgi:predicted RNA-binding protein with PUA-like domain